MKKKHQKASLPEWITDIYIITIFCAFLLFPGFSGYGSITFSKFVFLMAATGLWILALLAAIVIRRPPLPKIQAPQICMLAFLLVCFFSWLLSPFRSQSLLGSGRYDGLVSSLCYALICLGVSLFTSPKRLHIAALAVGVTVCCAVAVLQLLGLNALWLFPVHPAYGTLTYYDAGTLYSSTYLGTIGNTNILDAVLCCSLPLFASIYITDARPWYLVPFSIGWLVQTAGGGAGALVAAAVCALIAGPMLITDRPRLRRGARILGTAFLASAVALFWQPSYANRVLVPRLAVSFPALMLLLAAAVLFAVSMFPFTRLQAATNVFRRFFFLLDVLGVSAALLLIWFWPGSGGTLYELKSALHGRLDDSFGSSRIQIWRGCLALVPERPLFGGGPGTLAVRLSIQFSRYVPETGVTLATFADNAHNVWLGWLVNCGAAGLASLLALLVTAGKKALRQIGKPLCDAVALGALCGAVHGCFGLGLFLSEPFFWIILGLVCSCVER